MLPLSYKDWDSLRARLPTLSPSLCVSLVPHPVREILPLSLGHVVASAQTRSYLTPFLSSHRKAFSHTRISMKFTLSSNAWNGPAPPLSLSTCPAHTCQLIGFNCSAPHTRPTQTSTTETRVSRDISRGSTEELLSEVVAEYREACSWAE